MRVRLVLAVSLALIVLASGGCAALSEKASGFDTQFKALVQPYSFNFTHWETTTLFNDIKQKFVSPTPDAALNSQDVVRYFSYIAQENTLKSSIQMVLAKKVQGDVSQYETKLSTVSTHIEELKPIVEQTIARQIAETLAEQGIYNPLSDSWFKLIFPAVNFKLEKPLYMLVISPRDKIQKTQSITIKPEITSAQMQELESSVDQLNVSALVVQIGGLGATYPTFVVNNADLRFTIDTAAHEWLHQYLAFKPLGFRYVLDLLNISKNYEVDTINETVASIFGKELGAMVYNKYYSQYQVKDNQQETEPVSTNFNFNTAMRDIRKAVDNYLAQGQVEQAEKYMEEQRQYLATKGYYIRKLNQAYFAFYGSYADSPTSVNPIGGEVRSLRSHSASLKDFVNTAANIKSSQDLKDLISRYQ